MASQQGEPTMTVTQVYTKARKNFPSKPTDFFVELTKNSITLFKNEKGVQVKGTTFVVGDEAECDSYNLRYTGVITKITEKCVTIVEHKGNPNMERTFRLSLNEFCWRNFDFNAATVHAKNLEEMMYL